MYHVLSCLKISQLRGESEIKMKLRKGARDEFNSLLEQLIVPTLVKATHRGEREIRLGKGIYICRPR